MRRPIFALIAAAVLAVTVPSATAVAGTAGGARSPGDTPCSFDQVVTLNPGFSRTPSASTFDSGGETIPFVCTGTVNGKPITGPGTFGEVGRTGTSGPNSCTKLDGDFEQKSSMTLPTADGPVHLVDPTKGTYGPLQGGGVVGGTFDGPRFYGTFTILPAEGDCVITPLTKLQLSVHGWLVEKR